MSLTVQEFLLSKGGVGLLSLLHERPMTYSELESEIEVTSSTLTSRRDQAAELGLIDLALGDAEQGTKRVHHLTGMGEFLADQMARDGIVSTYRKMRVFQQQLDEQTDELVQWVGDNPSQLLVFEEAQEGTIVTGDTVRRELSDETGPDEYFEGGLGEAPTTGEGGEGSTRVIRPDDPPTPNDDSDSGDAAWESKPDEDEMSSDGETQSQLSDAELHERIENEDGESGEEVDRDEK